MFRKISIHTLRVEGDGTSIIPLRQVRISIHTLRVEGDLVKVKGLTVKVGISIHTLRVEGDSIHIHDKTPTSTISIHTLRVEGDRKSAQKISTLLFKSNRPAEKLPTRRA